MHKKINENRILLLAIHIFEISPWKIFVIID